MRRGDRRIARRGLGRLRRRADSATHGAQLVEAGRQDRVGGDRRRLGVGRLAVEDRGDELVVGQGGHGTSVRRSSGSAWFPAKRRASAARPRAILDRTVPGGIPSTSPISE